MCSTQMELLSLRVFWLPLLLSCFFVLCESQSSGSNGFNSQPANRYQSNSYRSKKSAFREPGVIAGIIVGVAGVLVVLGVAILLCRLFCCKQSSCCSCCSKEETYHEASTNPIKIPTENSHPSSKPVSTISQDRPAHTTHSRPRRVDKSPNPPQYDDIPQFDWKIHDVTRNRSLWDSDPGRRSPDAAAQLSDRDVQDALPASRVKRNDKAQTRRKLIYEANIPDSTQDDEGSFIRPDNSPKKRNKDSKLHGREFPLSGHKRQKRSLKPQRDDEDDRAAGMGENSDENSGGAREFPLLEFEPRTRLTPANPGDLPTAREESRETAVDDRGPSPEEYDHLTQPLRSSYPEHRGRMWGEERRPREDVREALHTSGPFPPSSRTAPVHFMTAGRVNQAFNQDSSETTV